MKKLFLIFMVLILTLLISIPKVYALEQIPNYYNRANNALTMVSNSQTSNGTVIRYQTDTAYVYKTIYSTDKYYDPYLVFISNENLYTTLVSLLNLNYSLSQVIYDIAINYDPLTFELIYFAEYSDDDERTKLLFPLLQYGGQNYVYVYTKEQVSYSSSSMFIISEATYNQYFDFLMTSNQLYQSGYGYGYNVGYSNSINDNYQPTYELGYNAGYNEGYDVGIMEDYSAWNDIMNGFFGPFNILNFELLPGFKIGYVFAFFMIIGVLSFLIGKRKA